MSYEINISVCLRYCVRRLTSRLAANNFYFSMTTAIAQTAAPHHSERAELERDLQVLDAHKQTWAALPPGKKSQLFAEVKRATARVAEPWVQAAVRAKGIPDGSPLAGEEWHPGHGHCFAG